MQKHQIKYLQCDKSGYHYGQALNMICLQQSCLDKALCCGSCIEQFHKNHKVKPLKLVILEAQELANKIKPVAVDTASIFAQLQSGKKDAFVKIEAFKQKVADAIASIQKSVTNWYSSAGDQVFVKTSGLSGGSNQLFESIHTQTTIPAMLSVVQKIIALIPKEDSSDNTIKENQLVERITKINNDINENLTKALDELLPKLKTSFQSLNNLILQKDVWSDISFKFSTKWKHNEIMVLNPNTIKSGTTQTYKFSILQPEFKKSSGVNKIGFKIKESSSNWLAFGVCHKNVIAQKNYSFVFNSVGHGAYLVSSNGGTWSHIDPQSNNQVKTFKFTKGDTVGVQVNYDTNKIKFKKKGGNDSYELNFVNNPTDPIYPCVLLYYPHDEVEVIDNYTDQ